ncbi:NUDIX hydrolase [Patescibacteria group bacterium]|nr:NUDIX hydrolase [Patescibacteria group bacterium]
MPHIILTVDCVVFNREGALLLIKRGAEPFEGEYALPGGRVDYGETTEQAAARELKEETGLAGTDLRLIGVYSNPNRDPRGHFVSTAYIAEVESSENLVAGDDAASAQFIKDWEKLNFAFDHKDIVRAALNLRAGI